VAERHSGVVSAGNPIHPTFGPKLRFYREQAKLGVNELGRKVGCSGSLISGYEKRRVNPSYKFALKVASVLGLHVSVLWDHTQPPLMRGPPSSGER